MRGAAVAIVRAEKGETVSITIRVPAKLMRALDKAREDASAEFGLGSMAEFSRNQTIVGLLGAGLRHAARVGYRRALMEE